MKHPVDTSQWGEFVTKDLFGPSQLGKYHNPKNLQESETGYPYICASNLNNGINTSMPYVTGDDLKPTPTNIISWGKQCPYFTYHDTPCITSQGMYYINVADYSKLQIDFIITVLTALTREYNYTNCLIGKIFDELVLKLPLKPSANPSNYTQDDIDWDYMDTVMSRVTTRAKERLASLPQPTDKKKTPVDTSAWGEFVVGELFDAVTRGTRLKKSDRKSGSTPLVTAGSENQGIAEHILENKELFEGITLTIDMFGNVFARNYPFYADDNILVLKTNIHTFNQIQFMAGSLAHLANEYGYTNQFRQNTLNNTTIKLPLKPSADPSNYSQDDIDWDFMVNFMQTIEEKAHARLVELNEQMMNEDD